MKSTKPSEKLEGFSKWNRSKKVAWLQARLAEEAIDLDQLMDSFRHDDPKTQKVLDGLAENTLANYALPYSIAPNFLINGRTYHVPMVIEESSVVAAASAAAKFWSKRGGIKAHVVNSTKLGQVHFKTNIPTALLTKNWEEIKHQLLQISDPLSVNMANRGGGVIDLVLKSIQDPQDDPSGEPPFHQILVSFDTCDSMGANFINTILEAYAENLASVVLATQSNTRGYHVEVIMAILSNYTPDCRVVAEVSSSIERLGPSKCGNLSAEDFAHRFQSAIRIAELDPYRATTHNKGIYNGVDAVVLATGNDFRAVEACGHTYAAKSGQYQSLSHCTIKNGQFRFWLELPLAVGTVGGLTTLHPLAKLSLDILEQPTAIELMQIIAATGLMQNFAAIRSLVTTGIQQGHMKMHLNNILHHLEAGEEETVAILEHFNDKPVSYSSVRHFLDQYRG